MVWHSSALLKVPVFFLRLRRSDMADADGGRIWLDQATASVVSDISAFANSAGQS
jgi:hypothetical protein